MEILFELGKPVATVTIKDDTVTTHIIHNETLFDYVFGEPITTKLLEERFNQWSGYEKSLSTRLQTLESDYKNSLIPNLTVKKI